MRYISRHALAAVVLAAILTAGAKAAVADVTWTPEGGWQRAAGDPDLKGADLFDRAFASFMAGRYRVAIGLFKEVLKNGDPALAEESRILLAESLLGAREYRRAQVQFERFVRRYPASRFLDRAMEGQLSIARATLFGARVRYLGLRIFPGYGIGETVVENLTTRRPFSTYAREAQLALARSYFDRRLYIEAASAWRQYLELFSDGEHVPEALLGVGKSLLLDARGPAYSPLPFYRAASVFETLIDQYGDAPEAARAESLQDMAVESLASHYYQIGRWYLKRGRLDAAAIYYAKVAREFPGTSSAELSAAGLSALRGGSGDGD